jgi:hypothetical protein
VTIYEKGDKIYYSNYIGISLLLTIHKILFNIVLSTLTSYVEKTNEDHQCGFWYNISTTDKIFCIHQITEKKKKKREYNRTVQQLFTDFKKSYVFVRQEILYSILSTVHP